MCNANIKRHFVIKYLLVYLYTQKDYTVNCSNLQVNFLFSLLKGATKAPFRIRASSIFNIGNIKIYWSLGNYNQIWLLIIFELAFALYHNKYIYCKQILGRILLMYST